MVAFMHRTLFILTITFFLAACEKRTDSVTGSTEPTEPSFVLDTLAIRATFNSDTLHIPLYLAYHFVGDSGNLSRIIIVCDTLRANEVGFQSAAIPPESSQIFSKEFSFTGIDTMSDSVLIRLVFSGFFSGGPFAAIGGYRTFSTARDQWVKARQ